MVLSRPPLAICFPSGLHATDMTLKLREVRSRINRNREKKTGKNSLARVPGHWALANVHFKIFDNYIIFEHMFINKKLPFRVVILTGIQINKRNIFFCYFPAVFIKKHICMSGQSILGKNNWKKEKMYPFECPVSVDWHSTFWNLLHLCHFRACIYQQKVTFSSSLSHGNSKQKHDFFFIFL